MVRYTRYTVGWGRCSGRKANKRCKVALRLITTSIAEHRAKRQKAFPLLQLRVLRLSFFEDGDVGIGVFPEGEEVFVGGERADAGGIGISAL